MGPSLLTTACTAFLFVALSIHKNVLINILGGVWAGALIVFSTPVFVSRLGLEGFGLIGFWQLLIYLGMVLDLGLGAACSRELARTLGRGGDPARCRTVFLLFERPVLFMSCSMALVVVGASAFIASGWLNFSAYQESEVASAVRWMGLSIAGQFIAGFYANALAGLQRMAQMNALQALNNGLRFLGGAMVTGFTKDLTTFFAYQAVISFLSAGLSRVILTRSMPPATAMPTEAGSLRQFMRFSGGMFFTAACGALISNADRLAVSKLLDGEALGRYSVALTATGLLQMLVFAFHRTYYPRFSELNARGDPQLLKQVYLKACELLGAVLIPTGMVFLAYTPQVLTIWLGQSDPITVTVSRSLVAGFLMSGLMWLPAACQQALGRTRLHAGLMAITLLLGIPLMLALINYWGIIAATSLALLHGVVQITLAQWLINRDLFPDQRIGWYRKVILRPLLASGIVTIVSLISSPLEMSRPELILWVGLTYIASVAASLIWSRSRV